MKIYGFANPLEAGHRQNMSWCSEWIRDWLRKNKQSQAALARLCGIGPDNISRWLSGQTKPDREAISRLASNLDEKDVPELLAAWLKDCLPDGTSELVRVEAVTPDAEKNMPCSEKGNHKSMLDFPPGMSLELQERLLFFGMLALENPDIRAIIDVCYQAAMRGAANKKQEMNVAHHFLRSQNQTPE